MTDRSKAIERFSAMLDTMTLEEMEEVENGLLYLTRGDKAALQRIPEPRRSQLMEICRRKEGTA